MATFSFKSVAPDGQVISGTVSASDQKDAIGIIRSGGAIPISAELQSEGWLWKVRSALSPKAGSKKLGSKLESFSLQMSSLLEAGIAVDECLQIIQGTTEDELLAAFAAELDASIHEGNSLTAAAEASTVEIPKLGINILRTSEAGGDLAKGFVSLARQLQRSREANERLKSALLYPLILTAVSTLSLIAIFTFVIPQFAQLFADMGDALPLLTRMVLAIAGIIGRWGWLILIVLALSVGFIRHLFRDRARRMAAHKRLLRLPRFGGLVLRFQSERYFRSLGALLDSGVTLNKAMAIARDSLTNLHLAGAAKEAEARVAEGVGISDAMERSGPWPALAIQLLRVGERTGDLSIMLTRLSDTFESEVRTATDRLLLMLEPLLVVFLGFVIAIIIISVLMGIMSVNDLPM